MRKIFLFVMSISLLVMSCNDDDNSGPNTRQLTLNISGLTNLGPAAQYEGWVIVNGAPVSTGTFTVNDGGQLSSTSFDVQASDLDNATNFVLTIEPIPDNDEAPSAVHILGGDFSANSADLTISHATALGTGFTGVSGGYILATPTTTDDTDELSGVWFLDNSSGSPAPGLVNLPDLTELTGWNYEGWAVIDGTPVSTGTFNKAAGMDDNATTSSFKGTDGDGPGYPGEDFINNAPAGLTFPTNLQGGAIVVSIEPVPDNDPAPFVLKPLSGDVPTDAQALTFYQLNNIAASTYPTGTATR
ncbi:anti-sigma factor [Fulvivirgaceae bacterium BMA10]|uniref:Anti-sigma factor n=1 Tax=Splendidivirga corallicola TaxID=3051826 RepID=A0ABT8KQL0_9BACT|nr:anti-sigma factor [Fulvivirgaceae bacterium BMA10]